MKSASTIRPSAYVDRDAWLLNMCGGRRVLHLGCVGFTDCSTTEKIALARQSLHRRISEVCQCTGIDLDAASVEELRRAGVFDNVRVGDVEKLGAFDAGAEKFDLVLAGDIIEHLSNPGLMLDGVKRLLATEGRLLVSTPNALGLPIFLRHARGNLREGAQHVLCFNAITLGQLLERHGYEVCEAMTCHQSLARRGSTLLFHVGSAFFRAFPRFGGTLLFSSRLRQAS